MTDFETDSSFRPQIKNATKILNFSRFFTGFFLWSSILIFIFLLGFLVISTKETKNLGKKSEKNEIFSKFFPNQKTISFKQVLYSLNLEENLLQAELNRLSLIANDLRLRIEEEKAFLDQKKFWPNSETMFRKQLVPTLRSTRSIFINLFKSVKSTSLKFLSDVGAGSVEDFDRQQEKSTVINRLLTIKLRNLSDTFSLWRKKTARETQDDFQTRFHQIQNPDDCKTAKKLVCDLLREACGLGCQLHYGVTCLAAGFALNRTIILRLANWEYSTKKWFDYFVPPSPKCQWTPLPEGELTVWRSEKNNEENFVLFPLNIFASQFFKPFRVEKNFANLLSHFHARPWIWWIGQLLRILFQVQPDFAEFYRKKAKKIGFKSPIVGVHVRRSDKIASEAKPYELEKYMQFVEEYYDKLELVQKVDQRRVFLASDAPFVYSEFRMKYPQYTLVHNQAAAKSSARKATRRSEDSLRGIMADMYFLAQTDHLVCTMSSNVCRVVYGLLQTRFADASFRFDSLDSDYIYVGAVPHFHTAVHSHNVTTAETSLTFNVGDVIEVKKTFWNGLSSGIVVGNESDYVQRSEPFRSFPTFPAYKIVENVEVF